MPEKKPAVLIIGNFDAVHRGHQELIRTAQDYAHQHNATCAVLTFEPHPRRLFRPDDAPFRITPPSVKESQMQELGVDTLYFCPFDWNIAALSPDQFITCILDAHITPLHIIIGQDFHFGQHRSGNADTLRHRGYGVTTIPLMQDEHHAVISATRIRGAIQSGHMDEANAMLGWDWFIEGTVEHGNKRGRELGYPTANVALNDTVHPAYGVYATFVQIEGETEWRPAATNIGIRPMFAVEAGLVEAYIFDYQGDLYGKTLRIRPIQKIRDEMKFSSLDDLIQQIDTDCEAVKRICAKL